MSIRIDHRLLARTCSVSMALFSSVAIAGADDLKAFPAAKAGMERYVIRVPAVSAPDEPEQHRVEVIVGKRLQVDCNRQHLGAQVDKKIAQGWGYDYYEVSRITGPISTMMACPPGETGTETFVQANADALASLRYNPRLPIVIYVPSGIEVRYRIWNAGPSQGVDKPE